MKTIPCRGSPRCKKNDTPLYIQLSNQLQEDIACRRLLPGTKLPPQRELADYLDVNVSTVSRAFKLCAQKGLLSGSVGNGTYVSYVLTTDAENPAIGVVGGLTACVLAWRKYPVMVCVLAAIGVDLGLYAFVM